MKTRWDWQEGLVNDRLNCQAGKRTKKCEKGHWSTLVAQWFAAFHNPPLSLCISYLPHSYQTVKQRIKLGHDSRNNPLKAESKHFNLMVTVSLNSSMLEYKIKAAATIYCIVYILYI